MIDVLLGFKEICVDDTYFFPYDGAEVVEEPTVETEEVAE